MENSSLSDDALVASDVILPPPNSAIVTSQTTPPGAIVVQVGEKEFTTTKATLAESHFLTELWAMHPPSQTRFFVDADPGLFAHILRYLRTRLFPLFYSPGSGGHDDYRYFEVLQAARFYRVDALVAWCLSKRYLEAVAPTARIVRKVIYGEQQSTDFSVAKYDRVELRDVSESIEQVWVCPRRISEHFGNTAACIMTGCTLVTTARTKMKVLRLNLFTVSTAIDDSKCLAPPAAEILAVSESGEPPPYET